MTARAFAALLERDGITVTGAPAQAAAPASAPVLAQRELAAACRDRRADAARVQQRDRGEPGAARGDRARHARHVQRRGRRRGRPSCGGLASRRRSAWSTAAACRRRTAIAPQTLVRVLAVAASRPKLSRRHHRASCGRLQRDAVGGRQRLRRDRRHRRRGGARRRAGQDRQPGTVATLAGLAYDKAAGCCFSRSWRRRCRAALPAAAGGRRDRRGGRRARRVRLPLTRHRGRTRQARRGRHWLAAATHSGEHVR